MILLKFKARRSCAQGEIWWLMLKKHTSNVKYWLQIDSKHVLTLLIDYDKCNCIWKVLYEANMMLYEISYHSGT